MKRWTHNLYSCCICLCCLWQMWCHTLPLPKKGQHVYYWNHQLDVIHWYTVYGIQIPFIPSKNWSSKGHCSPTNPRIRFPLQKVTILRIQKQKIPGATQKSSKVASGEDDSAWNLVDLQAWNHGRWGVVTKMSICSWFAKKSLVHRPLYPLASPLQFGGLSKCNSLKVTPLAES